MKMSCFKNLSKVSYVYEKFQETGKLGLLILSRLPWRSGCQKPKPSPGSSTSKSSQEGHIPWRSPEEENDPKGYKTRPSIYYRPKFIYKATTQLVKKPYPHSTTFLFLCFYVGHSTEKSTENLPGKIWKLQSRIVDPTFPLKLSHEGNGKATGGANCICPDFGTSWQESMLKELGYFFKIFAYFSFYLEGH